MSENVLADFPAQVFAIHIYCERCGHHGVLERSAVQNNICMDDLVHRLRCTACGARKADIRIGYTGPGEFNLPSWQRGA